MGRRGDEKTARETPKTPKKEVGDRPTDRPTDRQTNRQTDRQTLGLIEVPSRNLKTKQREVQIINGAETVKVVTKCQEHIVYTREPPGSYLTHSEIAPNK